MHKYNEDQHTHLRPICSSNFGGPALEKEGELVRPFSPAPTMPVLSARFFVFISAVTFLRPTM